MKILHIDDQIIVCIKPARVLSTDEPGGLPELLRRELKDENADIRTVHRLDRVVSGLMVLARTPQSASHLSRQIREGVFQKEYLAIVHGIAADKATLTDLLYRDKARKMTMVAAQPGKDVQEAVLDYARLATAEGLSKVRIRLHTGRTHQIRVQFSNRGLPLVGERKYARQDDPCELALWSCALGFYHPKTNEWTEFSCQPPKDHPWSIFEEAL